jgi:hypothetical protein
MTVFNGRPWFSRQRARLDRIIVGKNRLAANNDIPTSDSVTPFLLFCARFRAFWTSDALLFHWRPGEVNGRVADNSGVDSDKPVPRY